MFNYVGDISNIAHHIILKYLKSFGAAVDATLGNGFDTDFLSENFQHVFSFDIQKDAVDSYRAKGKSNVIVFHQSHESLKAFIPCKVDCIMYNLGFLPGGDKSITTHSDTTLRSLKEALELLKPGGLVTMAIYPGHSEGKLEEEAIIDFAQNLPKREYGVLLHSFINRNCSPRLLIIEKNSQ